MKINQLNELNFINALMKAVIIDTQHDFNLNFLKLRYCWNWQKRFFGKVLILHGHNNDDEIFHRIAHYLALIERKNYIKLIVVNVRVLFYIYIFHSLQCLSRVLEGVTMKSIRMIWEGEEVLNRVDRHKITHNKK